MNHLEQLVAEWYEYRGYFIRRNIKVGKRKNGGYDCELDIVGFNPEKNHLIHIEPSCDTDIWEKRELRYSKKFEAGREHIPDLFKGLKLPDTIEQQAVFLFGAKSKPTVGGGTVLLASDVLKEIRDSLKSKKIEKAIVPETFPLLRTLHIFIDKV